MFKEQVLGDPEGLKVYLEVCCTLREKTGRARTPARGWGERFGAKEVRGAVQIFERGGPCKSSVGPENKDPNLIFWVMMSWFCFEKDTELSIGGCSSMPTHVVSCY